MPAILRSATPQGGRGAVVLMHDGGGDRSHTVEALPQVIKRRRAAGYKFVTLDGIADLPDRMG